MLNTWTVNTRSEHYRPRVEGLIYVRGNFFAEYILLLYNSGRTARKIYFGKKLIILYVSYPVIFVKKYIKKTHQCSNLKLIHCFFTMCTAKCQSTSQRSSHYFRLLTVCNLKVAQWTLGLFHSGRPIRKVNVRLKFINLSVLMNKERGIEFHFENNG